jgi:hypothetical protein
MNHDTVLYCRLCSDIGRIPLMLHYPTSLPTHFVHALDTGHLVSSTLLYDLKL